MISILKGNTLIFDPTHCYDRFLIRYLMMPLNPLRWDAFSLFLRRQYSIWRYCWIDWIGAIRYLRILFEFDDLMMPLYLLQCELDFYGRSKFDDITASTTIHCGFDFEPTVGYLTIPLCLLWYLYNFSDEQITLLAEYIIYTSV